MRTPTLPLKEKQMLLTDRIWEDSHPIRRALAQPYQAWRCVAWTDEAPSFLVVTARDDNADVQLPDSWLVDGPAALLAMVSQLGLDTVSVYVLDRTAHGRQMQLGRVTGIWRERGRFDDADKMPWFWYGTDSGEMKPCLYGQLAEGVPSDLVSEVMFDEQSVGTTTQVRGKTYDASRL